MSCTERLCLSTMNVMYWLVSKIKTKYILGKSLHTDTDENSHFEKIPFNKKSAVQINLQMRKIRGFKKYWIFFQNSMF